MPRSLLVALIAGVFACATWPFAIQAAEVDHDLGLRMPTGETGRATAFEFRLHRSVAAIDGRLYYDTQAAEVVGLAPAGRGTALRPVDIPGGVAFGAYGLKPTGAQTVMRVVLAPLGTAPVQLRLIVDAAADAAGNRLRVSGRETVGLLRVAGHAPAAAAPVARPRPSAVRPPAPARGPFGSGQIGERDLDIALAGWELARANNQTCAADGSQQADANSDGCVDIVDIQATLAGQGALVASPQPETLTNAGAGSTGPTFVVDSTLDQPDASPGDGICADTNGSCTLRAAITESNWWPGENRIEFNLSGPAPVRIQLTDPTTMLIQDRSGGLTIDGYSQPGAQVNTAKFGSNAIPGVEVRGLGDSPRGNAFRITSPNNTIRGFLLSVHWRAVVIDGEDAQHNRVLGNLIGYLPKGSPTGYNGNYNVHLNTGASNNIIGTPALEDRNVIGRATHAIDLYGPGTNGNVIQNNLLCTTPSGTGTAQCSTGIDHNFGPKDGLIGGTGPNERNIIGRTMLQGIEYSHGWDRDGVDTGTTWQVNGNSAIGNWVGFRGDGSYDPVFRSGQRHPGTRDNGNGINVYDGANFNLIEGNYVASVYDGIQTMSANATGNVVRNNVIGESPLGELAPLAGYGVVARQNTRSHVIEGNVIRNAAAGGIGLTHHGVRFVRMSRNLVSGTAGPAIYLAPNPANPLTGANNLVAAPTITTVTSTSVSGEGISGATVELYRASRPQGQSGLPVELLGTAGVAADGNWSLSLDVPDDAAVSALQILPNDDTSALAVNVAVDGVETPPIPVEPAINASDAFERTAPTGWATADQGGPYSLLGNKGDFSVTDGIGHISLPSAPAKRAAMLDQVSALDVDVTFRVNTDKVVSKGAYRAFAVARAKGSDSYRAKIILRPDGSAWLHAGAIVANRETSLGPEIRVSGLTHVADGFIWLRTQVFGSNPTTVRVRAWADGEPEPHTWAFVATDSTPSLQSAGTVGIRAHLNRRVPDAPILFGFDDLTITTLP